MTSSSISLTLLVDDYEKAINYYCEVLQLFAVAVNTRLSSQDKYLLLSFKGEINFTLNLIRANTKEATQFIGKQGGGYPLLVLPVPECKTVALDLLAKNIEVGEIEKLPWGNQLIVNDPFGNKICLFETYP